MRNYKLALSNIAWTPSEDVEVYALMRQYGFSGLEIAPSRIWEQPMEQSNSSVQGFKQHIENSNLQIVAFQSLLFGHPEMTLFQNETARAKTMEYLKKNITLAKELGATALVFGSPKNRIIGNIPKITAHTIAHDFFQELGMFATEHSVTLCIEANPMIYGGDFICTTQEAIRFARSLNNPGIKINIDLGTITANSEDLETTLHEALPYAGHFHISEPYLEPIATDEKRHKNIASILNQCGYSKTVSIEMKAPKNQETRIKIIESILSFVSSIY